MKIGILGGGFGLYGYLPALTVGLGLHVVLPRRYQSILLERRDVRDLASRIDWVESDEQMLRESTALIIARRPVDQAEAIKYIVGMTDLERVLLEKPVAPDPVQARQLMALLMQSGKSVEVGYSFRFTDWSKHLAEWLQHADAKATLSIEWRFRAHHYAKGLDNWKRRRSQGGGALRFFGIHLIGLLAELGYTAADHSKLSGASSDDAECWSASITGPGLPRCNLVVDSNSDQSIFRLDGGSPTSSASLIGTLRDPFQNSPALGEFDRRTDVLMKLCKATFFGPADTPDWLHASIDLWELIERGTQRCARAM